MVKIAVFASGTGSNFTSLMRHLQADSQPLEVVALVCDNPRASVWQKAEAVGVSTWVHSPKEFPDKASYERAMLAFLQARGVAFCVLAGYMRIVTAVLLAAYPKRIINLHPALLPAFPGRTSIQDALAYGVRVTGVTVHYVDAGIDTGPIIAQCPVMVAPDDTTDTLAARIHAVEHALYYPSLVQALREQGLLKPVATDEKENPDDQNRIVERV